MGIFEEGTTDVGTTAVGTIGEGTTNVGTTDVGTIEECTTDVGTTDVGTIEEGIIDVGTTGISNVSLLRAINAKFQHLWISPISALHRSCLKFGDKKEREIAYE